MGAQGGYTDRLNLLGVVRGVMARIHTASGSSFTGRVVGIFDGVITVDLSKSGPDEKLSAMILASAIVAVERLREDA